MRKIPASMILCALLTTTSYAQSNNTSTEVIKKTTPESYRADHSYTKEWEIIKEENIAWKKRVWRTIDLTDKENNLLIPISVPPSIGDILLKGMLNGSFQTFTASDDRFMTKYTPEMMESLKSSGITGDQVTSLSIKEDWIFLKKENKMVVRIIAMVPVTKDGQRLFNIYYPEARSYFAQQEIATTESGPGNLDEVFEGRFFASSIVKVSGDDKPYPYEKRN